MREDSPQNLPEDQLRRQIAAGSHVAFNTLIERWGNGLYGFVQRRTPSFNSHEVEEIVQETFCRLWEQRLRLHRSGSIRSLLWAIAQKVTLAHLRRKRMRTYVVLKSDPLSAMPSPEEKATGQELLQCLQEEMAKLTDLQRESLALKLTGLSSAEIANQLGCSPKAVERRCESALKQLRQRPDLASPEESPV
jgi:RNA polymerase sigma factor (sigma-70 family)